MTPAPTLTADFSGLSVTGLLEVARVLPRTYATYRAPGRDSAEPERPDVFVAIDFPDFNFSARARGPQARRPGRLLHQPATLGLAPRPDEDHAPRSPTACW